MKHVYLRLALLIAAMFVVNVFALAQNQSEAEKCSVPIYAGKDLDRKPRILAKPEPDYTSNERRTYMREKVILRAVLCGSGQVLEIKVTRGVADEIDAKAVAAARRIRFIPGEKNGVKISRPVVLEYHIH